jgi:hypothetical protein
MGGYARHVRTEIPEEHVDELTVVDGLARELVDHIAATGEAIARLHVHGASSAAIQEHFALLLRVKLGFREEVVLTPETGFVTHARPDFVHSLGEGRGVLAEVERGGTTTNNHDLKDVWKAHIAPDAHHLFLIVPTNNWKADGSARERPFQIVARRTGAFFGHPRREIDLLSAHVFAY